MWFCRKVLGTFSLMYFSVCAVATHVEMKIMKTCYTRRCKKCSQFQNEIEDLVILISLVVITTDSQTHRFRLM